MESTIYRRRSDGQLVGTPENTGATPKSTINNAVAQPQIPSPSRDADWQPAQPPPKPTREPKSINPAIDLSGSLPKLKANSNPDAAQGTVYRPTTRVPLPKIPIEKLPIDPKTVKSVKNSGKKLVRSISSEGAGNVKRKSGFKRGFKIFRYAVLFYVLFFLALGYKTSHSFETTKATSPLPIADTKGTNWLLVGSDSRGGLSTKEMRQLHTGPDLGNARTDVLMIVHTDKNGTTLVSLPRDSYVTIPNHKSADGTQSGEHKNKINAAYTFGGAPLLVQTVELNTGLHIDHYMEIGFAGIRDITDAIGGVNICVAKDYNDKNSNLHVVAGCQHMNGKVALAYVRMRYADPTGDIGRIQRQQQYLSSVIHKVATPATVLNPIKMWSLSSAGTSSVVVGQHTGIKDIAQLGLAMKGLSGGSGKVMTVPVSETSATTAAGSSVIWDHGKAAELFASLGANK